MKSVRFHPAADDELLDATAWYLDRSTSAGERFAREIEDGVARIAEAPDRYPLTRFGRRRFVLLHFPYDLVYRVTDTEIEIIAIVHHARRPGYWRTR